MHNGTRYRIAVAGASGYAGGEILRILSGHPSCEIGVLTAHSQVGQLVGKVQPHLRSLAHRRFEDTTPENFIGHDVVFLALPHGKSGEISDAIAQLAPECLIIDCGADHRLIDVEAWDEFYGGSFHAPWVYGVPELLVGKTKQRDNLIGAQRIAAPGCNASTVALALTPGISAGVIDGSDVVAVLAVGPSGAGKSLKPNLLASEILGSASPYAVGGVHRHIPEIQQALRGAGGEDIRISFTPVLVPMSRGILATCSAPLSPGVDAATVRSAWETAYSDEQFVQLLPEGQHPATGWTVGANTVLMSVTVDEKAQRVVVIAAVDNLAKGTAGAAVQSMNIALGLPEGAGLSVNGVAP
ncbi:N-acetyl-gamma-glutamyl-phosphate reductase [Actinomycetaceae bacterium WB03_NA08]|uniref:N-acetyl-gamma-glutamyl-phosphate reductase n=1 Tax=Scrofimicrobium canadense TaxID=2652290 RepID=A0A6N7W6L9_9ACTO|nr:N-acetyl-gamma-glutamyl-phosphate reductase [Scrofimicrobium canadense]MSS83876.1 N-acetyl-gamma-glutamyl-phosphate reductase [Scrofimicrobium canadense]